VIATVNISYFLTGLYSLAATLNILHNYDPILSKEEYTKYSKRSIKYRGKGDLIKQLVQIGYWIEQKT